MEENPITTQCPAKLAGSSCPFKSNRALVEVDDLLFADGTETFTATKLDADGSERLATHERRRLDIRVTGRLLDALGRYADAQNKLALLDGHPPRSLAHWASVSLGDLVRADIEHLAQGVAKQARDEYASRTGRSA